MKLNFCAKCQGAGGNDADDVGARVNRVGVSSTSAVWANIFEHAVETLERNLLAITASGWYG